MTGTFDKTQQQTQNKCYNITIVSGIFQIQYNTSGIWKIKQDNAAYY